VIDLHSHVLPGIDDGPATIEESIALVATAAEAGTREMVATSHVSWHYPNEATTIARLTATLNDRLDQEGIAVKIWAGAEIAMTRVEEIEADELERLHLGDGPWLLLEPPFTPIATGLERTVRTLQDAGHRVVLAHPERCPAFHRDPQMVGSLVRGGALSSLTAGSLVGRFGGEVRRFARRLLELDLVHNIASDAHDATKRPPGMAAELEQAGLTGLQEWLLDAVPAAILSGEEIPQRPATVSVATPKLWRRRWRR
jgi:protein-tyrosine phosphatase